MPNVREAREALGNRLRELRTDAGMNGRQLAQSLGWQPAKVSKIEHGKQTPTDAEIRAWAVASGAPEQAGALISQLRSLELAHAEWKRHLRTGTRARQVQLAAIEAGASLLRIFEPATVPGLLQTPEYARSIFAQAIAMHKIPDDLDEGVEARMERQKILYRPGRKFHFIVTEAALRNLVAPPDVLMGQIERLIATSTLPNVVVGVIPFTARLPKSPVHGFWIYEETLVMVETFSAEMSLIQPDEIELYGRIFALMHDVATYGRPARAIMTGVLDDLAAQFFPETSEQA
ncbi:helix-turn-helix transcriptional regulator [Spongiactinospora sp. TRM90649]|uniref:helix-turn-helix domain-containing protein n=1 Tax=Spongiactinospora sp. TRM90649 TaxID=3031114 RepID=UPI0023F6E550|nr:helix-turn-helix transcriptional regulator [Spongiactinospora sp. TRM90649]MDF5758816.1 helix-turn-helix transcriptional regulator [Spongiactinospora sp. TRM90649]